MTINLTCTQVSALLSFYINDKLNEQLRGFVAAHLDICPTCRAKYEALKDMITSLKEVHEKVGATEHSALKTGLSPQYNDFKRNLSAYVDSELNDEESIKVKKYVISNPKAREDLERMYKFKKLLHSSFEKAKSEVRVDFSKFVVRQLDMNEEIYGADSLGKVVAFFVIIFAIFTISAMLIFWI